MHFTYAERHYFGNLLPIYWWTTLRWGEAVRSHTPVGNFGYGSTLTQVRNSCWYSPMSRPLQGHLCLINICCSLFCVCSSVFTVSDTNGVFTLAWSGTRTGTGKKGLYGYNKNLSHCTWTGTGKNTWNIFRTWRMGLVLIFQVLKMCPVMNISVLPCPCSSAVWKVLIKTIQPILPGPCAMWKVLHNTGPCPCPSPSSGPSECEYTIRPIKIGCLKLCGRCSHWVLYPFYQYLCRSECQAV